MPCRTRSQSGRQPGPSGALQSSAASGDEDPAIGRFLEFLAQDIASHPGRLQGVDAAPRDVNAEAILTHWGCGTISEPFEVQTFVSEFPVEALVGTILPRFARIDQRSFDPGLFQPPQDGIAHELRAVVRTQIHGQRAALSGGAA